MERVTVVILNWNGKHWLEQFLPSVLASSYSNLDILLIDNASTDDSVDFVRKRFPAVRVEVLDRNYGFAEGNNRALPFIDSKYFVLLNSDVEVSPGWLEPLVARMESDPHIASIQPKIRAFHQKTHFEYAGACGGYMDRFAYPFCRGRLFDELEEDKGQYDTVADIFWATGACCLIRKSVVDKIGLFEGQFFAHMEEIDFCWRAKNAGYRILCEPESIVYHVGGGALPQGNPRKTYLNVRNSLSCMFRNLPKGQVFPKIMTRLLLDGVWGIKALLSGDFKTIPAIIKGHFHFYALIGTWRKFRNENKSNQPLPPPHSGYLPQSIVWQHFAKGIKTFSEINHSWNPH